MSFYLDDDDLAGPELGRYSDHGGNNAASAAAASGFVCDNCGGTESYMDESSGGLVCVDCFTQSQTMIDATQEEMDFEDTMALAGRTSGRLIMTSTSRYQKKGPRTRQRLQDMDRSAPLPNVEQCIVGFQRILKETTILVAQLMDCSSDVTKVAMDACRTIWKAYMTSWMQGAQYYGAIYPEVRFCFRDTFLDENLKKHVINTLTYQVTKKVREEVRNEIITQQQIENEEEGATKQESATNEMDVHDTMAIETKDPNMVTPLPFVEAPIDPDSTDMDDDNDDGNDDDDSVTLATTAPRPNSSTRIRKQLRFTNIAHMIWNHQQLIGQKSLGRKATALYLSPSMDMAAAIVCLAFQPYGVTCANMRAWMETGKVPLLNAFSMLIPQERKHLKSIKSFFRLRSPPSTSRLEMLVASMQVACGYEPPKLVVRKVKRECLMQSIKFPTEPYIRRLLTPRSLPLTTARIVAQLGLSQTVLNYSLALMGLPFIPDKTKIGPQHMIPRPLRVCRTDKILGMAELLGVIVSACKFIPQWEDHWYEKAAYRDVIHHNDNQTASSSPSAGSDFVPWNRGESHRLYGSCSKAHLELFEKKIMKVDASLLFSANSAHQHTSDPPIMVQDPDVTSSSSSGKKQVVHPASFCFRLHPSCRRKSHQSRVKGVLFEESEDGIQCPIPAAPFGTLIEYVASKTGAKPMDVFKFHLRLGHEMERRQMRHDERIARKRQVILQRKLLSVATTKCSEQA